MRSVGSIVCRAAGQGRQNWNGGFGANSRKCGALMTIGFAL